MAEDNEGYSLNELTWAARILLELAESLLSSADIKQALKQSNADADTLREAVAEHSDDLICAADTSTLIFTTARPTSATVRRLRFALIAAILLVSVIALLGPIAGIIASALFVLGVILVITYVARYADIAPLEPDEDTRDALKQEVLGPFLRDQINQILTEQGSEDTMLVTTAPGLAELSDRESLVHTETMSRVAALTRTMSSGSIGVSGPRGVGKSTLLQSVCGPFRNALSGEKELLDIRITVRAPVVYDAREFILHLFGKLCESLIGSTETPSIPSRPSRDRKGKQAWMISFATLLALLGASSLTYGLFGHARHLPTITSREKYLALGALLLALGLIALGSVINRTSRTRRILNGPTNPIDEANLWLTRIRYLQTFGTGYTGSLGLPFGTALQATESRQLAELQLTLPELVDHYRSFAPRAIQWRDATLPSTNIVASHSEELQRAADRARRRAAVFADISASLSQSRIPFLSASAANLALITSSNAELTRQAIESRARRGESLRAGSRILIGIDELDKLSAESAERFLNDIKAIFDIPGCLYLVSVSDEALAVFSQRIINGRTAFDSSFDTVIQVRELNFAACRTLLRRRVAGMPDSLIGFCQAMSGGLPRDLIRVARLAVEACAQGLMQVEDITAAIIVSELDLIRRSYMSDASRASQGSEQSAFLAQLFRNDWPGESTEALLAFAKTALDDEAVGAGFASSLYLYATIAEIFGPRLSDTVASLRNYMPGDSASIDQLAEAHNLLSVNAHVARELVDRFRSSRKLPIV